MSDYMPVEVILEILKRLPVKSLGKCRSVCKTWNSLINNPSFISSHLQTALPISNTPILLIGLVGIGKENYILHFDNDDFDEFKQLRFPFMKGIGFHRFVGSCYGLVCLIYGHFHHGNAELFLWNPSIQKYITLPNPKIDYSSEKIYNISLGFGFDQRTNDYKLLKVVCMQDGEKGEILTEAYLFSLNGNSWKKIAAIPPKYGIEGHSFAAFINGALHWLGYERGKYNEFRNMVLGLDISTEEFFVMNLPESLIGFCPMDLSIMKYDESSIAVLKRDWGDGEQFDGELLDVWVMEEYGVVGSWTKVLHLAEQNGEFPRVLGFRKNGDVLLEMQGGELSSMDLKCQKMEHLGVEIEAGYPAIDRYVESLVLLDKGVDASQDDD